MRTAIRRPLTLLTAFVLAISAVFHPGATPISALAAYTTGDMTYHGGHIMPNPTNYVVFWLPPGQSFEPPSNSFTSNQFESLVGQYFSDICPSQYYNILNQLSTDPANGNATVTDGPIQN